MGRLIENALLERIGVHGSAQRNLHEQMESMGFRLVRLEDESDTKITMVYAEGNAGCLTYVTYEDRLLPDGAEARCD